MKIGILALQGNFNKHAELCTTLGLLPVEVRYFRQLEQIQGLIIPGGESTTMTRLMERESFYPVIGEFGKSFPVLGTCAGLILMAREVPDERVHCLGLLDITVNRNAFGRQVHSFTDQLMVDTGGQVQKIPATFIRAPGITSLSKQVNILSVYRDKPVAVRQGLHLGLSFHPELDGVTIFHEIAFNLKPVPEAGTKQQSYAA
ncbi:MAG: pyridoxal 5'-phosphate synthase glutaminase subunit PdxT [Fidelibacterota bacterium]